VIAVKDLLGHASFDRTTEKPYIMGQSRLAGRGLAEAIDIVKKPVYVVISDCRVQSVHSNNTSKGRRRNGSGGTSSAGTPRSRRG
jgi:hypothetical protein